MQRGAPDKTLLAPDHPEALRGLAKSALLTLPVYRFNPDAPGVLGDVVTKLRQQRNADPMQAAQDAGTHGITALNPADPQAFAQGLRQREAQAGDVASDMNTPAVLLSRDETEKWAQALQSMAPAQKRDALAGATQALQDPAMADTLLRQLSAEDPASAAAGLAIARDAARDQQQTLGAQPWGRPPDVGLMILKGQAKIDPSNTKGATPYLMPDDSVLINDLVNRRSSAAPVPEEGAMTSDLVDRGSGRLAGQSGKDMMELTSAKALYAALDPTNGSAVLDPVKWGQAVGMVPRDESSATSSTEEQTKAMDILDWRKTNPLIAKPDENPKLYATLSPKSGAIPDVVESTSVNDGGATVTAPGPEAGAQAARDNTRPADNVQDSPTDGTAKNPYGLSEDQLNKAETYLRDVVEHGGVKPEELTPRMRQHIEARTREIIQRAEELKNVPSMQAWDPTGKTPQSMDTPWNRAIDSIDAERPKPKNEPTPNSSAQKKPTEGAVSGGKLKLGPNIGFQSSIEGAAKDSNLAPWIVAGMTGAEAAPLKWNKDAFQREVVKRITGSDSVPSAEEIARLQKTPAWGKVSQEIEDLWDPNSNGKHVGVAQFDTDTWRTEAERKDSYLNKELRKRNLVGKDNKLLDEGKVFDLRKDPDLSIRTLADMARHNLDDFAKMKRSDGSPMIPPLETMSAEDMAYYAYLIHHEGRTGAIRILEGTLDKADAARLLRDNVKGAADRLITESGGDATKAYTKWLKDYIARRVSPSK